MRVWAHAYAINLDLSFPWCIQWPKELAVNYTCKKLLPCHWKNKMKMYFIKKRSCSIFSSQVAVVKLHDQERQSNERAWLTLSDLSLSEPEQGRKGRNLKTGLLTILHSITFDQQTYFAAKELKQEPWRKSLAGSLAQDHALLASWYNSGCVPENKATQTGLGNLISIGNPDNAPTDICS